MSVDFYIWPACSFLLGLIVGGRRGAGEQHPVRLWRGAASLGWSSEAGYVARSLRRLCADCAVCSAIFMSFFLSLSAFCCCHFFQREMGGGAWHDVHVVVCLHAMFSVWRGLLLRTHRSRRLDTLLGVGGNRQMQVEKFLGIFFGYPEVWQNKHRSGPRRGWEGGWQQPPPPSLLLPIKRHRQSLA